MGHLRIAIYHRPLAMFIFVEAVLLMGKKKLKIGMGQLLVEGGEPDRNFERAGRMVAEAALLGCDIILLPECMDLAWTHPSCFNEAEEIPGIFSDKVVRLAKENNIHICCGLTEHDGNLVYNAAILVDDSGDILLKYRKINVLDVALEMYQPGQSLSVIDTRFGKIGINICSDNYHDALDIGYVLGRMGAQIILSPSSWTVDYSINEESNPYGDKWLRPYQTLADLFNLVIVGATSVGTIVGGPYEGKKMVGCSLAVGPQKIIAKSSYNEFSGELFVAVFDVPEPKFKGTEIGAMLSSQNALAGQG
jgi:predicted amidohydrolase